MLLIIGCLFTLAVSPFCYAITAEYINFVRLMSSENRNDINMSMLDLHYIALVLPSRPSLALSWHFIKFYFFCNLVFSCSMKNESRRKAILLSSHIYYNGKEIATLFISLVSLWSTRMAFFFSPVSSPDTLTLVASMS